MAPVAMAMADLAVSCARHRLGRANRKGSIMN